MFRTCFRALLCAWLLILAAACQSSADWHGVYGYTQTLGEDPGGAAMLVEYRLELGADLCRLTVSGYQVNDTILCTLAVDGGTAVVRFRSYSNGKTTNLYGIQVYQVGEPLFTLRRAGTGEATLVTEWNSLQPDAVERKQGTFFARQ
ncbi:DUF5991 domain-containing protein [Microbulbifer sp. SAOS-129_SWC]|uniref:DUF5991 domain-containing protein n=1 Tax=Microbulbifer sp. SAOS-129_SWC TaxID=3145235 RepID=UPI0032171864